MKKKTLKLTFAWQAAQAAIYEQRLSAIYARLSKVLTPEELKLACDRHAIVQESVWSARESLFKLRHQPLIKDLCAPLSKLKPIETFNALLATLEASVLAIGDHELTSAAATARDACLDLLRVTDSLRGRHGHPDAHDALIMRNVVGTPGTLDMLAGDSDTTRRVQGVLYTVLTPRRTHCGAVGTLFKPMAPERIGTISESQQQTIDDFRAATKAANIGAFLRITADSMLKAIGESGAAKVPELERFAIGRFWTFVADEANQCQSEDLHCLLKSTLFMHVEEDGKTGGWLYQMAPEFTSHMWAKLVRGLDPAIIQLFLANVERSVALMTETAEQGTFLYFQLDETSETVTGSASFQLDQGHVDGSAESKRNAADNLDHAATKRPCCRESTV